MTRPKPITFAKSRKLPEPTAAQKAKLAEYVKIFHPAQVRLIRRGCRNGVVRIDVAGAGSVLCVWINPDGSKLDAGVAMRLFDSTDTNTQPSDRLMGPFDTTIEG